MRHLWTHLALAGALTALALAPTRGQSKPTPPSFANDVIPALTKLGCNQGSCHGQQSGKGGFKLSLRGWDPAFDYEQITRDAKGRRIDPNEPGRSLLLLKATGRVPHGGGALIAPYSESWQIVHGWLTAGRPAPSEKDATLTRLQVLPTTVLARRPGQTFTLAATATFNDGTSRSVTRWARYTSQNEAVLTIDEAGKATTHSAGEATVLISYGGLVQTTTFTVPFAPSTHPKFAPDDPYIDRLSGAKLARLGLTPAAPCTDAEFIRRATLDTLALLPTPDETRRFLNATDPAKREKLVDRLLARPEWADYRALKLADLLRVNGQLVGEEGAEVFARWIHDQVERNVPYDRFVRELLTSKGSTFREGPANFFRVAQAPEDLAETTAQAFLGTRIACAKCHNHPFENWKQADYYGLAAFFARYGMKYGPEFGETAVYVRRDGDIANPRTKKNAAMRVLGGTDIAGEPDPDRRAVLAKWLTSPDNKLFAKVAVNRLWADHFGRGIVDPVDDFRISNPPSNPELLDALADDFIASGYDIKAITRKILLSRTYQRSSEITPGNARDTRYFARAYPRRIPAEALLDAIGQVTLKPERFWPYPAGFRATQLRDSRIGQYFLEVFGRPKREIVCSCERSQTANLAQSLHLINSGAMQGKLAAGDGRIPRLFKDFENWAPALRDARMVEELYFLTLCRPPSRDESAKMLNYIHKQKDKKQGFEDALWALLNSEEFLFNK